MTPVEQKEAEGQGMGQVFWGLVSTVCTCPSGVTVGYGEHVSRPRSTGQGASEKRRLTEVRGKIGRSAQEHGLRLHGSVSVQWSPRDGESSEGSVREESGGAGGRCNCHH